MVLETGNEQSELMRGISVCFAVWASAVGLSGCKKPEASETEVRPWGPATNGLQLGISVKGETNVFEMGKPMVLQVSYRNITSNEVLRAYCNGIPEQEYRCYFLETPHSREPFEVETGIPASILWDPDCSLTVPPETTTSDDLKLSMLYNFREAGVYRVSLKRAIYETRQDKEKRTNGFEIVSNPLKFYVVPSTTNAVK